MGEVGVFLLSALALVAGRLSHGLKPARDKGLSTLLGRIVKWWFIEARGMHLHRGRPCRWLPKGKSEFRIGLGKYVFHLQASWRRGIWLALRDYRGEVPRGAVSPIVYKRPSMKRRVSKSSPEGGAQHLAPVETNRFADMMSLVEHLAYRKYDDGEPREPGWVTIKTQGAAWVVQVKDPDAAVSFSAIGETLDKALETAALLLACDEAPWEPDTFLAAARARKAKK